MPVPVRWRGGVIGDSKHKRVREKRETAAALHLFCIIPEEEEGKRGVFGEFAIYKDITDAQGRSLSQGVINSKG